MATALASVVYAQTSQCQKLKTQIESALLHHPQDTQLQAAWLALQQCQEEQIGQPKSYSKTQLNISSGYEENPGLLATQGELSLWSTSGASVNLPLARSTHPSAFINTQLVHQHQFMSGTLIANASVKSYNEAEHAQTMLASADYQHTRGAWAGAIAGVSHQNWQGVQLNQSRFGWQWWLNNSSYVQLDWREKRYQNQAIFDSRQLGVMLTMQLPWQGWQAEMGIYHDQPSANRAGGMHWGKEARISWQLASEHHIWQWGAWLRHQQDEEIYSDFILNKPKRDLLLKGMVLRWQTNSYRGWQPFVQAELWQQEANIGLFRWQNQSVQAGIRWLW